MVSLDDAKLLQHPTAKSTSGSRIEHPVSVVTDEGLSVTRSFFGFFWSRSRVDPDHKPDVSVSVHHSCEEQINLLEQRQQQKTEGSRRRREANLSLNHCRGSRHRASVSAVGAVVLLTPTFDLPLEL